jgi:hypothetical protein
VRTTVSGSRRARRLACAGLLWAAVLVTGLAVLALDAPGESSAQAAGPFPPAAHLDSTSRIDPLFSRVVSRLAGREAKVHCWSRAHWAKRAAEWAERWPQLGELGPWRAYSLPHTAEVHLSPAICALLRSFVSLPVPASRTRWPYALAWSVQALSHESVHVKGIVSEVKADCYGMQSIDEAMIALGRSRSEGRYLASAYWNYWYPAHGPDIRSSECRNGGRLDLSVSALWP